MAFAFDDCVMTVLIGSTSGVVVGDGPELHKAGM